MFICEGCAKNKDGFMFLGLSRGPCEICHYTSTCIDAHGFYGEVDPNWKENLRRDLAKANIIHDPVKMRYEI